MWMSSFSHECGKCGILHEWDACPAETTICYECGKIGHFARKCYARFFRINDTKGGVSYPSTSRGRINDVLKHKDEWSFATDLRSLTENKLRKFINKPRERLAGRRTHTPLVLSDSKGNWLQKHVRYDAEKDLLWASKGGASVQDRLEWLKTNLGDEIESHGDIWLYVWLGTCNLTSKNKRYISLKSEDDREVNSILEKYEEIVDVVHQYPGCKVTIMETPVYSIQEWNKKKGHKDPSLFEEKDEILSRQISMLNSRVREINNNLGTNSPDFTSDLKTNVKYRCGLDRKLETSDYYSFHLYCDGIHPDGLLAKTWLRKISEQARLDCWDKS